MPVYHNSANTKKFRDLNQTASGSRDAVQEAVGGCLKDGWDCVVSWAGGDGETRGCYQWVSWKRLDNQISFLQQRVWMFKIAERKLNRGGFVKWSTTVSNRIKIISWHCVKLQLHATSLGFLTRSAPTQSQVNHNTSSRQLPECSVSAEPACSTSTLIRSSSRLVTMATGGCYYGLSAPF